MGRCQPSSSCRHDWRSCRPTLYALLHSVQVITTFFLLLYTILLSISLPTSFSPLTESALQFQCIHAYQPIPYSSVCQCLDTVPLNFFTKSSSVLTNHSSFKQFSMVTRLLLILSGNISLNPGPATSTNLIFSHINTRSCTTVTDTLDKPTVLQEFIFDQNLDALALTETWLSPDTPASIFLTALLLPAMNSFTRHELTDVVVALHSSIALLSRSQVSNYHPSLPLNALQPVSHTPQDHLSSLLFTVHQIHHSLILLPNLLTY